MADFQISLSTGTGTVALSASQGTLTISDYSNYITSTEDGNLLADFSLFKKVYVTDPEGIEYEFSTILGGDQVIATPSTYIVSPVSHSYTYTTDGVFRVELMAVPTYSATSVYQLDDCVYLNSNLYKALTTTSGTDPETSVDWELILESELPDKYSVIERIAITDLVELCWAQAIYDSNCTDEGITVAICDDENICKNKIWRKANRLDKILTAIPYFVNLEDWVKTQDLIDKAGDICDCE